MHKRVFFGIELEAPWLFASLLREGRVLEEKDRHVTIAFLGSLSEEQIAIIKQKAPAPDFLVGPCGHFTECLFCPPNAPRLVAWKVDWLEDTLPSFVDRFRKVLLPQEHDSWLSHMTLCRNPVHLKAWAEAFTPLPCYAKALHLYESLGGSRYIPLTSTVFHPPFLEIEHTADRGFWVYGKDLAGLYNHALTALSFSFPPLLEEREPSPSLKGEDELVFLLNRAICRADSKRGCPFKAVSFHGAVQPCPNNLLQWEMIVDV